MPSPRPIRSCVPARRVYAFALSILIAAPAFLSGWSVIVNLSPSLKGAEVWSQYGENLVRDRGDPNLAVKLDVDTVTRLKKAISELDRTGSLAGLEGLGISASLDGYFINPREIDANFNSFLYSARNPEEPANRIPFRPIVP